MESPRRWTKTIVTLLLLILALSMERCHARPFASWSRIPRCSDDRDGNHRAINGLLVRNSFEDLKKRGREKLGQRSKLQNRVSSRKKLNVTYGSKSSTAVAPSTKAYIPHSLSYSAGLAAVVRDLRGGATKEAAAALLEIEVSDLVESSYEWCANLGAPAALVAGAVVATIYEVMSSGELNVNPDDTYRVRITKKLTRMLLLSAFALEIMCIFVTTVTGTMLLSRPLEKLLTVTVADNETPLSFLDKNFEFEYLTARISFLQGLMNWLGAIGLAHAIPHTPEEEAAEHNEVVDPKVEGVIEATRCMSRFSASALLTMILLMLSFYNNHLDFYKNYATMIFKWKSLVWDRFIWHWPPRPLAFIYCPSLILTLYWFMQAVRIYG